MKFNYTDDNERGECVAYIDNMGVLHIKTDEGCTLMYENDTPNHGLTWYEPDNATKKFYKGDKLEITF